MPHARLPPLCFFLCADSTTMTAPNRRSFLQLLGLWAFNGVLLVTLLGLTLWAAGALYFMLPLKEIRGFSAAVYVICGTRPAYGNPTFVEGSDSSTRPVFSGARVDSDDSPFERRALGTRCRADGLGGN